MKLYGAKCYRCGCLLHDGEQATEPKPWLPKPADRLMFCADCDSCQVDALFHLMASLGDTLPLFGREVGEAVQAFRTGADHPLLDQLRAECQAIEAEDSSAAALRGTSEEERNRD